MTETQTKVKTLGFWKAPYDHILALALKIGESRYPDYSEYDIQIPYGDGYYRFYLPQKYQHGIDFS